MSRGSPHVTSAAVTPGSAPMIDVGQFDHLDESAAPTDFVEWMEHQRRAGSDRALDLLGLGDHDRVLDVGCGTGVDLEALAQRAGHAIGIDRSFTMANATRARQHVGPVSAAVADGQMLPFPSGTFDACWARAVLIHTEDPQQVVNEMARILRDGGRVVLSEPDHGSHIVSTSEPEIFERVKQHRRSRFRQPLVGRRLVDLAATAGLTVSATWALPIIHRSFASARAAGGPFDVAVEAAVADAAITSEEAACYLRSLADLDGRGAFFFAGLAVSIAATR